ncbi:hypothetical protein ACWEQN_16175 [Streptomyces sp. NPDC004129]
MCASSTYELTPSQAIAADAHLETGGLPVGRIGLGALRLAGGAVLHLGTPSDPERSMAVLRPDPVVGDDVTGLDALRQRG